jgi:hypothetical protein
MTMRALLLFCALPAAMPGSFEIQSVIEAQ